MFDECGLELWPEWQNFWDFWPPPPLVRIWDWSTVLNSHNLPYYIFFWANPPPPSVQTPYMDAPLRVQAWPKQFRGGFAFKGKKCSAEYTRQFLICKWTTILAHFLIGVYFGVATEKVNSVPLSGKKRKRCMQNRIYARRTSRLDADLTRGSTPFLYTHGDEESNRA